jgi:uncharacterized membrane protein
MATFVYSAAGLFTVGLAFATRTEDYPRLAVSVAIVLLFISLGMVVYFADHLAHAIQIDAVNRRTERDTRRTIARTMGPPGSRTAGPWMGRADPWQELRLDPNRPPTAAAPPRRRGRRHHLPS